MLTTPPSSPSSRATTISSYDTPSRGGTTFASRHIKRKLCLREEDAALILQNMHTNVSKQTCRFYLNAALKEISTDACVDTKTGTTNTKACDSKDHEKNKADNVSATYDKIFCNLKTALNYFKQHENAVGTFKTSKGDFVVRSLVRPDGKPNIQTWGDHDWLIVRCEHKNRIFLIKLHGLVPVYRTNGCSRRVYKISPNYSLHLKHFTCLHAGLDRRCSACTRCGWKLKCFGGIAVFKLVHQK